MKDKAPRFPLTLDRLGQSVSRRGDQPPKTASGISPAGLLRPQRPLRESAVGAGRTAVPVGHGLDSDAVRQQMVVRLRQQGIECERVLRAMATVPRHRFVDSALVGQAYEDTSLPIGWGQTISKPMVVARMLALLVEAPGARQRSIRAPLGRALEIGTGCGYQAAVMAHLASHLTTIERVMPLYEVAAARLSELRVGNLRALHGDGRLGHAPNAPYDSIVAAAGGHELPQPWMDQLAMGGRLVAPMHDDASSGQVLVVVDRTEQGWVRTLQDAVHFVPLKSGLD
jgi:protein-L-isoaspartate(D-aspartate) O-methyltransferase